MVAIIEGFYCVIEGVLKSATRETNVSPHFLVRDETAVFVVCAG